MGRSEGRHEAASLKELRSRRVQEAFAELPDRYLGTPKGFDATFQVRLGDVGRTWEVRTTGDRCEVRPNATREPDVVIGTDASTWLALREGRASGLDAFARRRLYVRGDLDLALGFEGLFRLPGGRAPLLRIDQVETSHGRITTLIAGSGDEHVICLHGLGGTKSSFFQTVAALSGDFTVHAIDLPGFGSSSKPSRAPYNALWLAGAVRSYMDQLGVESAHLVGNSMGGRIALEVGFSDPLRVRSLSLLSPALAFIRRRRELVPLVKLARPELAAIPHPLSADTVRSQLENLFAQPERLDPAAAEVAVDEFRRAYGSRAGRVAFFRAARNIYLDEPHGEAGFYARLAELEPAALFIWGAEDWLIPAGFARHVERALPRARQVVLEDCGHVPQVELPEQTNRLIREQIEPSSDRARHDRRQRLRRPLLRRAV
jgi:pimeloyl-ACP methyl ester carboxylesterase/putative sterol carrier protein